MRTRQPLSKTLLIVVGLLTAMVVGLSVYLACVTSDWWRHGARLAVWSDPLVATGLALLVAGLALGCWELARAVRRRPRLSPLITLVILCGAIGLAPLCITNGLRMHQTSASTKLLEDLRLPESPEPSTANTKDQSSGGPSPDAPILKLAVFADGRLTVDGLASTVPALRESLRSLKEKDGAVWYYREAAQQEPPAIATEAMQAVIDARLPIRLSSQPDYSDSIGFDGQPITK